MEDSLISLIGRAKFKNDTNTIKDFISVQSTEHFIGEKTLHFLQSIAYDSKELKEVKFVLYCVKYFSEKIVHEDIWNRLAKTFVDLCNICLKKCVGLHNIKEDTVFVDLFEVISALVEKSELLVKTFHYLMVPSLLGIITKETLAFEAKLASAKIVSCIVKNSIVENHYEINKHFEKDIADFANWIFSCGDYETQTIILESLVYFFNGTNSSNEFCSEWFHLYPQIRAEFFSRNFIDFEPESRMFLNLVNKVTENPLVFTIACVFVYFNGVELKKPNDPNYLDFWVDFNICSESVLIYVQGIRELWTTRQIYNKDIIDVHSKNGQYKLNNQNLSVIRLCFTFSSISEDLTANYLEIGFKISEEFHKLEYKYLIPIYESRYHCNWESSTNTNVATNDVLNSEIKPSVDKNVCKRKYRSVMSKKRKDECHNNSQPLEENYEKSQIHSRICTRSDYHESNTRIADEESSVDEILSTPDNTPVKSYRKKKVFQGLKIQGKKTDFSSSVDYEMKESHNIQDTKSKIYKKPESVSEPNKNETYQKTLNKQEKKISKSVKSSVCKKRCASVHNKGKEISKKSCLNSSQEREDSFMKTPVKNRADSPLHKKLFCSQDKYEDNLNCKSVNRQQNQSISVPSTSKNILPKVSYSYRAWNKTKQPRDVAYDFESAVESPFCANEYTDGKTLSEEQNIKKRFFKSLTVDRSLNSDRNSRAFKKVGTKSVYSDFSTSSERSSNIKTTNVKKKAKNVKKKQQKVKPFSLDCNVLPKDVSFSKNITRESYVSRLEKQPDPLRFKDKEHQTNTECINVADLPVKKTRKQKLIGRSVFTEFDNTKENLPVTEHFNDLCVLENDPNVPLVSESILIEKCKKKNSPNKDEQDALKDNPTKSEKLHNLKKVQFSLKNNEQKEYKHQNEILSDHEAHDIEMMDPTSNESISFKGIKFDAEFPSVNLNRRSKEAKNPVILKEDYLVRFAKSITANLVKNIEETEMTLKPERDAIQAEFISHLEHHKSNISSISIELEKCKKSLEKTMKEIDNEQKKYFKTMSTQMSKESTLISKHIKDFKSEIKELAKDFIENMKK